VLPVKLTEQLPELSVQLVLVGETPAPLAVKLTVPVGVVGVPDVSVTVTVQLEAWPITTGLAHERDVEVGCVFGARLKLRAAGEQVPPPLPMQVDAWVADVVYPVAEACRFAVKGPLPP
jgi:hypothetical protein